MQILTHDLSMPKFNGGASTWEDAAGGWFGGGLKPDPNAIPQLCGLIMYVLIRKKTS